MLNADAVLVAMVAADGAIDKMELATGDFSADERAEMARYQTKGAAGDTNKTEDQRIFYYMGRYLSKIASRGGIPAANAVLAAIIDTDDVIDKMELATDVFNSAQRSYLANFQTAAASNVPASLAKIMTAPNKGLFQKYVLVKATP